MQSVFLRIFFREIANNIAPSVQHFVFIYRKSSKQLIISISEGS